MPASFSFIIFKGDLTFARKISWLYAFTAHINKIALITVLLSACGGGGGSNVRQTPNTDVDFATPVRVGAYSLFTSGSTTAPVQDIFVQDLNNDNKEEVVISGRMSQSATELTNAANQDAKNAAWQNSQISIFGWNASNQLENQTSSWFSGTDNRIIGTEPSVKFGDFNGDDNVDMVVGHSTDMNFLGETIVYTNAGTSSFSRQDYNTNYWTHDVTVHDINGDGFDDVVLGGYGNTVVLKGDVSGTLNKITTDHSGMSGLAAGDFLGNGTVTFVFVDSGGGDAASDTHLYSFTQTGVTTGTFTKLAVLPDPIFDTPAKAPLFDDSDEHSHDIRALPFDFNNDNSLDVVIIGVSTAPLDGRNRTEIQFLKNNGSGTFTDVTATVRVGWDEFVNGDYNPQLRDINDDGLVDILLSSQNSNSKESTRVLLQTIEGKYVQSFTDVFEGFVTDSRANESNKTDGLNTVRFLTGPNGDKFLVTAVTLNDGSNAVYTSKLGDLGGASAQASIALIQQVWPYVTDDVAAQILASTAFTNFEGFDPSVYGAGVIDLEKALLPIGELRMPVDGRSGTVAISGEINGFNLSIFNNVMAVDSLGRMFVVNINSMHTPDIQNHWYDAELTENATRMDYSFDHVVSDGQFNYSPSDESGNFTTGMRNIKLAKDWYFQGQYTQLAHRNPWFHMSGMWGTINSSQTIETVVTHVNDSFMFHVGNMHTITDFNQGLVTAVAPIDSIWGEISWKDAGLRLAVGSMPYVIKGGIDVRIPSTIDQQGVVRYDTFEFDIENEFAAYSSVHFAKTANATTFSVSGYSNTLGFYQTEVEVNFAF
ncbi:MAG: VCBS repeat-containing protein [Proteobacteria bacterium]|nr:VCBS repeat-containing protein [Pseudomonadota bacterium]